MARLRHIHDDRLLEVQRTPSQPLVYDPDPDVREDPRCLLPGRHRRRRHGTPALVLPPLPLAAAASTPVRGARLVAAPGGRGGCIPLPKLLAADRDGLPRLELDQRTIRPEIGPGAKGKRDGIVRACAGGSGPAGRESPVLPQQEPSGPGVRKRGRVLCRNQTKGWGPARQLTCPPPLARAGRPRRRAPSAAPR